ncbi:Slam-dependent surface lipoprotein [Pseudomonas plecoglossicida]|uniref:Slam-dependent surface lipoprotein n=1 Tax=Pseudomonas plecoglossicida TaxID=70775 RepID=UPI0021594BB4|nr:Slam-dependent surface lipoprotein [Pseudomonas plecoglossicida]
MLFFLKTALFLNYAKEIVVKKLFVMTVLSLVTSGAFAATVSGYSSSIYVQAAPSNLMAAGTAGIAMPTTVGGTANASAVVSFKAGPIAQTNALLSGYGTTSALLANPSTGVITSQTWKNKVAYNTEVYAYRQIAAPSPGFPQFGGEVIAKVSGAEVYFGEWAPAKSGAQPTNSTDLNLSHANRTVWFVGENPTTSMPALVNAKYNVVGINQYNPGTAAGVTSGVLTANYGSGSGTLAGSVGSINFAGTTIAANGSFARSNQIKGQFYGNNAEALAGIYTSGTTKVAFGGAKQ